MKVTIHFKSDQSSVPYCAYVTEPVYQCRWSRVSFEDAEQALIEHFFAYPTAPPPPPPKVVEIPSTE